MEQVAAIYYGYPDEEISRKLDEWYNWLYSQLGAQTGFVVCPDIYTPPTTAIDALRTLDDFPISEVVDALPQYLGERLLLEGRRFAQRTARRLFRRLIRTIILGS